MAFTVRRPGPRSLAGQMTLLIALALFVAQAINFGLALRDRAEYRLSQATGPVAVRLVDALEREAQGRPLDRGRVQRSVADPIAAADRQDHPEVIAELRRQLAEAGLAVGRIDTGLQLAADDTPVLPHRAGRHGHPIDMLVIAVEQPGHGWLTTVSPWPRSSDRLLWSLIGQTLILFAVILLPVLWIARRISRPLRALTDAARGFNPAVTQQPLAEQGPEDLREVTRAFNTLRLRVTAMLDEKDRMLGAIGHDLRTPLAALRVRIESVDDDEDRLRMADTIDEMNRTLDDILSLARLGRPSEAPTVVDLPALVDAVVEDFRDLDQDVMFEEAPRLTLRLRPSLMRRAVRNLIENAVKYGRSAEVRIIPAATTIAIEIADHGPGIPPEQLNHVFDAFTRLETSRNRETGGIGLGLALARAIVQEAGGDIVLANRPAGGLAATIRLPRGHDALS